MKGKGEDLKDYDRKGRRRQTKRKGKEGRKK
jgi:hypothetical protein